MIIHISISLYALRSDAACCNSTTPFCLFCFLEELLKSYILSPRFVFSVALRRSRTDELCIPPKQKVLASHMRTEENDVDIWTKRPTKGAESRETCTRTGQP